MFGTVPEEYDYHFKSAKKDRICEILGNVYKKIAEKDKSAKKPKLGVTYVNQADLKEKVGVAPCSFVTRLLICTWDCPWQAVTKVQAKSQSREDIVRRKQVLQAQYSGESDKEDDEGAEDVRKPILLEQLS